MTFYCAEDNCNGETRVMQTKGAYRRRKCRVCGKLSLTEEIPYKVPSGQTNPLSLNGGEERKRQ